MKKLKLCLIGLACFFTSCNIQVEYEVKVYYQDNTKEVLKFVKHNYGEISLLNGCLYRGLESDTKGGKYPSGSAIRCGIKYIVILNEKEIE